MRHPTDPALVARVLAALWRRAEERRRHDSGAGARRIRRLSQRLGLQAMRCVSDAMLADRAALVPGSADLLTTLFALWAETGLDPSEVWTELHKREQLGSLLMQLNQAQGNVKRRVLKPWRVDSTKLP
jgi:phosphoribosyl-ATP pyrophosphohydrolase